jgi:hypothetical protein
LLGQSSKAWTDAVPDLSLAPAFPVSKASMARKIMRDLLGITGLKKLVGTTYLVVRATSPPGERGQTVVSCQR